ncbi:glycosyltransferase, partial [Georgenia sp. 10Sc9-8]|nr:glycosyltransferase [Georgenia halotolerans]
DGTFPYQGIEEVREGHPRSRWVWSRRGMWKQGRSVEQVSKSAWFDAVLEPGDLAAPYDVGATRDAAAHPVGPVTLLDTADLQDRRSARQALGLPAEGPLALLSLGAGNLNDTGSAIGAAGEALRRLGVGVCVTVPEIASSGRTREADVHLVRDYPLSRRYAAFDVAISAAGYNSFHELLRFGVPTLFVPNVHTQLDDQAARAQYAADQGWSRVLPELTADGAEAAVAHLLAHGADMAAAAQARDPGNGAAAAAELVGTMAREVRG